MIETERLILRPWRDTDADAFVRLTNTEAVMAHLGGIDDPVRLGAACGRQQAMQAEHGHCFWMIERKADGELLGFCGLKIGNVGTIEGEIEIGWRLREDAWGQGYAREGAEASLAWAWANLTVDRVVAITVPANTASWGLMKRLGMTRRPDLDFGHPGFEPGHPLYEHITYVIERPA